MPKRKIIQLNEYDYSLNGAYFVTICVKDKHELLGRIALGATVPGRPETSPHIELIKHGRIVDNAIKHNNRDKISISKYVIMPNHINIIFLIDNGTGDRGRSPLQTIVCNMKAYITNQFGIFLWQKPFRDHIIRNQEEYDIICVYIDQNPARWQQDKYFIT